ncbi:unnamed protein product, partial [Prorocentrum cordatum]
ELLRMRRRRGAQEVLRLSGGRRAQSAGVGGRRPPARGDARRGREGARPGSRGARWGSWQGAGFWRRQPAARMGARARRGRQRAGQANKERRYRDKGSESVTKNPYRSLLVLRRCVLKQHCLARERHPERSLPAPMEHCHFASGARQLWRGAPTRNETRIERGRRRRRRLGLDRTMPHDHTTGCGEGGGHETRKRGPPGRARSARAALARPPAGAKGTLTKNKTKQNGAAESGGVSEGRAGEAGPAALKRTRRWQQGGNHLQHVATATSTRTKRIARSATVPPGTLRRGRMPK